MTKNSQKGISLVEILLSLALIGFIFLTISNVPNSIRLIGSTQKESLAKNIATKEIEQLRVLSYDNIANGTVNISDSRLSSLPLSTGTAVISNCPISICQSSEQTKQVLVTVSWQDDNNVKKVQITTFITKGGLQ